MALSREERIAELWRRGRLRYKLYPDQREVYDAINAFLDDPATRYEQFFVDICRQYGKTYIGLTIATERALRNAGWRIVYTAATRTGLWQFVQPNMEAVLADCPAEMRPQWSALDSSYHFANGAQIHLAGVNNGHENDARGPKADLIINEEFGFVDRPDYLVKSIELPMLTTTGGRIIHITTPAETPAHASTAYKAECIAKGHYVKRTIDDNHHLSDEAKAKLIVESGGREATQARRELWCEDVVDEAAAIIPEFGAAEQSTVAEWKRPAHWEPYETLDPGFSPSHCGVLYGYYDFLAAKLVVEDESDLTRMRTDVLAAEIKQKEMSLWEGRAQERFGEKGERERYVEVPHRWSDIDAILLNDLGAMHRLPFAPTSKDTLDAMVNKARIWVKGDRIRVHPRCKSLVAQLKSGVWNKQRTEFAYSAAFGHYDLVACLVYMVRNCPETRNPYPSVPDGVASATHFIHPRLFQPTGNAATIEQMFGKRPGRA